MYNTLINKYKNYYRSVSRGTGLSQRKMNPAAHTGSTAQNVNAHSQFTATITSESANGSEPKPQIDGKRARKAGCCGAQVGRVIFRDKCRDDGVCAIEKERHYAEADHYLSPALSEPDHRCKGQTAEQSPDHDRIAAADNEFTDEGSRHVTEGADPK